MIVPDEQIGHVKPLAQHEVHELLRRVVGQLRGEWQHGGVIDSRAGDDRQLLVTRREEKLAIVASTGIDRKSTRLNSSHTVISYAVFCLKKKNNRVFRAQPTPTPAHRLDRAQT